MMKWLRKYSKQIMVVVVLLAMFSFVGSSALTWILSPERRAQAVMMAFGKKVTNYDLADAGRMTEILTKLFLPWKYDLPDREMQERHWYMLAEEANRAGIQVADQEVEDALQGQLAQLEQRGLSGSSYLETLRINSKITPAELRRAFRQHLAIQKYHNRVRQLATPSEPEVKHFIWDTESKVNVKFLALDAEDNINPSETFTPEELQAQFEANKNVFPKDNENGFGYRQPQRIKLQYIVASSTKIEPQIEVTQEEAIAYWKKNKAKYKERVPATQPVDPASTQPVQVAKEVEVEKTFSKARPDVERELRKQKATRFADQAMRKATTELLKPWESVKTDSETQYKPIPAGVEDANYLQNVCTTIQKEFNIPLTYEETTLSSLEDLQKISILQTAKVQGDAAGAMGLLEYAFRNPKFIPKVVGADGSLHLQLFQTPDAPLLSSNFEMGEGRTFSEVRSLVLFRVVDARDAAAPENLEEVRKQVENDIRLTRAYQKLEATAQELYAITQRLGTAGAGSLFTELSMNIKIDGPESPAAFARQVSMAQASSPDAQKLRLEALKNSKSTLVVPEIPGIGSSRKFVDACFELAQPGWQSPASTAPKNLRLEAATTRPAVEPAPVVRLLGEPKLKKWVIIELVNLQNVDEYQYESTLRAKGYNALRGEQDLKLYISWFAPKQIEERCSFKELADRPVRPTEGYIPPIDDSDGPI